eukprot:752670-Hanusia_phi.AAC.3
MRAARRWREENTEDEWGGGHDGEGRGERRRAGQGTGKPEQLQSRRRAGETTGEVIYREKQDEGSPSHWEGGGRCLNSTSQWLQQLRAVPPRMRSAPRDELLGKRTRVEARLSELVLLGLDLNSRTFSSSVSLTLSWRDSRLLSSSSNPLGSSVFDVERLRGTILTWRPDLRRASGDARWTREAAAVSVSLNASGVVEEQRTFSSSWSSDPVALWVNQTGIARLRMSWAYPAGPLSDNSSSSWVNDFEVSLLSPSSLLVQSHLPQHRVIFAHSFADSQGLHVDLFVEELPSHVALKFVYPVHQRLTLPLLLTFCPQVILIFLFVLLIANLQPASPEILGGKFLAFQISLWSVLVVVSIRSFDASSSMPWLEVFFACSLTAIVAVALVMILSSSIWEQQGAQKVVNRKLAQQMRLTSNLRKARMFKWGSLGAIACTLITSTTSEFLQERARKEELPAEVNSVLFDPGAHLSSKHFPHAAPQELPQPASLLEPSGPPAAWGH